MKKQNMGFWGRSRSDGDGEVHTTAMSIETFVVVTATIGLVKRLDEEVRRGVASNCGMSFCFMI